MTMSLFALFLVLLFYLMFGIVNERSFTGFDGCYTVAPWIKEGDGQSSVPDYPSLSFIFLLTAPDNKKTACKRSILAYSHRFRPLTFFCFLLLVVVTSYSFAEKCVSNEIILISPCFW